MTKNLVVGVAILALSTSVASATHRIHHHAMNPPAAEPAPQVAWTGGVSGSDHAMYLKNLHDSGYNPKNDFTAAGNMANQ